MQMCIMQTLAKVWLPQGATARLGLAARVCVQLGCGERKREDCAPVRTLALFHLKLEAPILLGLSPADILLVKCYVHSECWKLD